MDPLLEAVAQNRSTNINYPLLGHLRQVQVVREVEVHELLGGDEIHHLLEAEVLVLGDVQGLHVVVVHVRLLTREDIFQEVDRDVGCKEGEIRMS